MKLGIIRGYDEASFQYVQKRGLSFIESCRNSTPESDDFVAHVADIKANIAKYNIPIASVGRWNPKVNIGGKLDAAEMASIENLLKAAVEVGSPVFVCGINYAEDVSLYRNYCAAVEYFGRLLELADDRVKVAVYNCDWGNFIYSETGWKVVLGEFPKLGIKYDCSHAYNRGQDYLAEMNDWGERIYHVHIKGTTKTNGKRHVDDPPAGMDDIAWPSVFSILYARGYDAGLSLEPHSSVWRANSELGERGIDYAINYIRPFILR